jgi:hypothetical protein
MFGWLRIILCLSATGATKVDCEQEMKKLYSKRQSAKKQSSTQLMKMQPRKMNKYFTFTKLRFQFYAGIRMPLQLKNNIFISLTAFTPHMVQNSVSLINSVFPLVSIKNIEATVANAICGSFFSTQTLTTKATDNAVYIRNFQNPASGQQNSNLKCSESAFVDGKNYENSFVVKPANEVAYTLPDSSTYQEHLPTKQEIAESLRKNMIEESLALSKEIEWEWQNFMATKEAAILERIRALRRQNDNLAKLIFA